MKTTQIMITGILGTMVLVVGVLAGGILLSSVYADSPGWCREFFGRGMMGRGMMWGDRDAWNEWGPFLGDEDSSLFGGRSVVETGQPLTIEEVAVQLAASLAEAEPDLRLAEVMEFDNHFYAEIVEKDTGSGAYEVLVDRYDGDVYPEMGPNMMWNEKYGMHGGRGWGMMGLWSPKGGGDPAEMPVSASEAVRLAAEYLADRDTGLTVDDEDVTPFYGYYTLHTLKDGAVDGMLSVNGYGGEVWPHTWHGDFVRMTHDENEGEIAGGATGESALATYRNVTPGELAAMLQHKNFLLINVHVPYEGELRNTDLFIPYDEIAAHVDELPTDKDASLVLYCRSDAMSRSASETLAKLGYTQVYNLSGGFDAWQAAGYDLLRTVR